MVNEVPPLLSIPGSIIMLLLLSVHEIAVGVLEDRLPVPPVLEVTDMLVNVTDPKLASDASVQVPVHTLGLSVMTSALAADAAESVMTLVYVQPAVVSTTISVHTLPDSVTDAVIALPAATLYDDPVETVTMYPLLTAASPYISYHALYSGVDPAQLVSVPSCSTVALPQPSIPTHCTASSAVVPEHVTVGTTHLALTALNVPPLSAYPDQLDEFVRKVSCAAPLVAEPPLFVNTASYS
jgi:hypothetical protein